jgi:hypothetical protein
MQAEAGNVGFDSWGIVELLGHVRVAGRVTEEQRFGATIGRVDIPTPDGSFITQYFGGGSLYRLTPCSEATARAVAARNAPEPVHPYEMPSRPSYSDRRLEFEPEEDDDL